MTHAPYATRLAKSSADMEAAFALRYQVFGLEIGANGPSVDHVAKRESDAFDAVADHLLLTETSSGSVVGTYRLIDQAAADKMGQFYTENEFDLRGLKALGQRLLEVGRTCLSPDHRGGAAMLYLWAGLVAEVKRRRADWVFGVGSFAGTDAIVIGPLVRLLEQRFGAPPSAVNGGRVGANRQARATASAASGRIGALAL
jgi:putative hemolysin